MSNSSVRVRFAPAPTGMMHLGNVRTALMNYLVARQKQGAFVLRIEDTDAERNFDPGAQKLQEDLAWLSLHFDEGPGKGGAYGPYYQSERTSIYQENLQKLIDNKKVYRCFCTTEELEKKRQRQIALKQPPRYDRTCHKLSDEQSLEKSKTMPFIWRMYVDPTKTYVINDWAHGPITFEMKNFSDFPLTRQDGSTTFIFANFIDDVLMKISCVMRGEEHLSNTAVQATLYDAFNVPLPNFWHMPLLCNTEGKKLSKRDFGFSLRDLKEAGYLQEALLNYLAIIGSSFKEEIMSLDTLVTTLNFDSMSSTGHITYDVEKLRWVNHKWISRLSPEELEKRCRPFIEEIYPHAAYESTTVLASLLKTVASEMNTLRDAAHLLNFYFATPECNKKFLHELATEHHTAFFKQALSSVIESDDIRASFEQYKKDGKAAGLSPKQLFCIVRYILTGRTDGISIVDLLTILDKKTINERFNKAISLL